MNGDNDNKRQQGEGKSAGRRPSHLAFQVRDGEDGKTYFNRIGSAWPHKDGEGFSVLLDATPIDGRVTLRTAMERAADSGHSNQSNQQRQTRRQERRDEPGLEFDR